MTVTRQLCEKIASMTADQIGETAIAKARQLLLDGIAVAVAGARMRNSPRILAGYLRQQQSKPESAALGFGFRLAPVPAALLNATSMHVLDFEPMWTPATHALSPALAPALALAESMGSNGREVLAAFIKGVDIQGRFAAPADTSSCATSSFILPAWWGRSVLRSRPRIFSISTRDVLRTRSESLHRAAAA